MPDSGEISFSLRFNWKTVFEAGLIWAVEYGILSLIEDAPMIVKFATIGCAGSALILLQIPGWYRRYAKIGSLAALGMIYLGFIAYAANHAWVVSAHQTALQNIYAESTALTEMVVNNGTLQREFAKEYTDWEKRSADWIGANIGEIAKGRFLNRSFPTAYAYTGQRDAIAYGWGDCGENEYNCFRSRLQMDRDNLTAIMQSKIYGE